MKDIDNRLVCSEEKKNKIRETRSMTRNRRTSQVVKCYELKIVEKRLNKKQHEQLNMLFVEGKRFYNHVLNINKTGWLIDGPNRDILYSRRASQRNIL